MSHRVTCIALILIGLGSLRCATTLLGTDPGYKRVLPEKPLLSWTGTQGAAESVAFVSTRLATKYLSERSETRRYLTDYTWANRGCWFGASALMVGAAVKMNDWGQHYRGTDTVMGGSTTLAILSALPFLTGLVYPHVPLPARRWEKDVTFENDTSYQFAAAVVERTVTVSANGTTGVKTMKTDKDGKLAIDTRDFYDGVPADSVLRLTASTTGLSAFLVVPAKHVTEVKKREDAAAVLLKQAQTAEQSGKDETALTLYDSLYRAYAGTRAAAGISVKVGQLREKVKQARLAQARREIERVSQDRVQNAIGLLLLTEYESNSFAQAVEYLDRTDAASVMKDGCCFPLTESECTAEYSRLTLYQKFYALLKYKEALGNDARPKLTSMLNLSFPAVDRFISIEPRSVLR